MWSYNQGLAVGGLLELWRGTGEQRLLDAARRLADAAMTRPELTRDGVLTESCDVDQRTCDDNQKQFKGVFMRYLADLASVTGDSSYDAYARRQADTLRAADRDPLNRLGQRWSGTAPNQRDRRTQAGALAALS